ncbi:hypothetical protein [Burkholderia cenocepacia]|jgi:hypothetical protein|uniref:hypothetical protein n=1 Tax=Burkholderia cenocepacia TaxID=95486 RepID=UPI000F5BF77F|nr:hypothetical protein [Burkholderia cenocepacia]
MKDRTLTLGTIKEIQAIQSRPFSKIEMARRNQAGQGDGAVWSLPGEQITARPKRRADILLQPNASGGIRPGTIFGIQEARSIRHWTSRSSCLLMSAQN